jgi:hypothetical protein
MYEKVIGVDCQFEASGQLSVRRVEIDGRWMTVGQGRQWVDHLGRHVLIMLPGDEPQEIRLDPKTMRWSIVPAGRGAKTWLV